MTATCVRPGRRAGWAAALAVLGGAAASSAQLPPVSAIDLLRLRTVSEVQVSRDGHRAVFVVRSIAPDEWRGDDGGYANRSHLWTVDLTARPPTPRQLTYGPARDSGVAIAPDGTRVAFVRDAAPSNSAEGHSAESGPRRQVWVLSLDGGEARQVTFLPEGASQPAWSPDGRLLAVVSPVPLGELPGVPPWPQERPGRQWNDEPFTGTADGPAAVEPSPDGDRAAQLAWLAQNAQRHDPVVINRLDFVDDRGLRTRFRFDQIFLVDPEAPEAPPRRLTNAFADHREPAFLPPGDRIAFTTTRAQGEHIDRVQSSEIRCVTVDGRTERPLAVLEGWRLESPQPSPDGTLLAFRARRLDEPAFRPWQVGIVTLEGGEGGEGAAAPMIVTEAIDRSVIRFAWQPATASIVFTAADEGGFPLLTLGPGLIHPADVARRHDGFPVGVHAFGAGGAVVVYARTTPKAPSVLVYRDGYGEHELLDLNPWVRRRELSLPEERWISRPDGLRVQSWTMPPAGRRPGHLAAAPHRAPLVVAVHGGPKAMWGPGELSTWHELQFLCGRGFGVVYCNPRGSDGYGFEFARANRQDWGPGPAGDVLAAAEAATAHDWVDRERLVLTGGSYGGFLTAYILTRDSRFRAAVADRGVYDLDTFFGEGRAWRLVEWAFGGFPFDLRLRDLIERHSPVKDARRIRTPLLIMHGDNDRRVGVAQSEMLYRALRFLGRPVEYVRYPAADHDMSRRGNPRQRIDRLLRTAEFFERFVGTPKS